MIQAQWDDIIWEVSKRYVKPIKSIDVGIKLDYERKEDSNGAPPTQIVRRGLQTLSLKYDAFLCFGVDPKYEFDCWSIIIGRGTHAIFYLNGKSFGGKEFVTTNVKMSSEVVNANGVLLYGEIALDFEEYAEEPSGLKVDKGFEIGYTPGIQTYNQDALEASLRTRASDNDKLLTLKSIIGGAHHVRF